MRRFWSTRRARRAHRFPAVSPASAASGRLCSSAAERGRDLPHETVVCILTGHQLKDPATVHYHMEPDKQKGDSRPEGRYANRPIRVADDLGLILEAMGIPPPDAPFPFAAL